MITKIGDYQGPYGKYENGRIEASTDISLETIIKEGADKFIEKGALPLCEKLWDLNIFTLESEGYHDRSYVVLDTLSPENLRIFERLKNKNPENYVVGNGPYHYPKFGEDGKFVFYDGIEMPTALADAFQMQDITRGFRTVQEFLLKDCDCYKQIPNPNYKEPPPMPNIEDYPTEQEYEKAFLEHCKMSGFGNPNRHPTIEVFDETKVEKPIEEYLKEHNIDLSLWNKEEKRIYHSHFYLDRHNKYLEHVHKQKAQEREIRGSGL